MNKQQRKFLWKIFTIAGLIAIVILATFNPCISVWFSQNEPSINLVCWIIGIGGVWMITNEIRKETEARQKNAVYGFYFNLQTYLSKLEKRISTKKKDAYDYYFVDKPSNHQLTEATDSQKEYIFDIASSGLAFFNSQENVVPPFLDEKSLKEWDDAFKEITEFLISLEGIKYNYSPEIKRSKADYQKYKENIIVQIKTVLKQIQQFRIDYFNKVIN